MNSLRELASALAPLYRALQWVWRRLRGRVVSAVGGPARTRVVVLFAGVLALSSAQISTIGAVAPQLETSLHLDNTKIGLLNSVTLLVSAVAVIPFGLIVDRVKRIPILSVSIVLWSMATILGAVASSYGTLLLTRVVLGVVSASAGPAIASLTGDYFPSRERGRVYGYILTGEILGTAVGFIICGNVSSALGWRASFWVLAIPGFFLARELWRTVPEPRRGGYSRLERGVVDLQGHERAGDPTELRGSAARQAQDATYAMAEQQGYRPNPRLVLRRDPDRMSLGDAVRYVLSIPTNVLLIFSSSLGYFFFSGLETFATVFVRSHFHVGQSEATLVLGVLVLGAIIGTLASGPVCEFFTRRGQISARVWVPAACNLGAGLALIPGLLTSSLTTATFFCFIGTGLIAAANPPLDAARLDIMPAGLWGRAESTRTFLRSIAQAVAPLAFGGVADLIAGFTPHGAIVGTHTGQIVSGTGTGLQVSFLIMLLSLFAAAWFLWRARPTYAQDLTTAAAGFAADVAAPPSEDPAGESTLRDRRGPVPTAAHRADDAPTAVRHRGEDPTVARDRGEDPTVARDRGEDPTLARDRGEDPTLARDRGGDPTVSQTRRRDLTAPAPPRREDPPDRSAEETEPLVRRRDEGDDAEPLVRPR